MKHEYESLYVKKSLVPCLCLFGRFVLLVWRVSWVKEGEFVKGYCTDVESDPIDRNLPKHGWFIERLESLLCRTELRLFL